MTDTETKETRPERSRGRAAWLLLPLLALAAPGCGDSGAEPEELVTLSISTAASGQQVPTSAVPAPDAAGVAPREGAAPADGRDVSAVVAVQDTAGNEATIDGMALVVGSIEIRPAGTSSCEGGGDCVQVADQPLFLPVPLDGSVHTVNPAGRLEAAPYGGIHLQLRTVEESDGAVVDSFPEIEGASMLLEGTYNDSSFVLAAGSDAPVALDLSSSLDLSGAPSSANITILADSRSWLVSDEGVLMDPDSSGVAREVADNVIESLSAFPDEDADGSPDGSGPVGG